LLSPIAGSLVLSQSCLLCYSTVFTGHRAKNELFNRDSGETFQPSDSPNHQSLAEILHALRGKYPDSAIPHHGEEHVRSGSPRKAFRLPVPSRSPIRCYLVTVMFVNGYVKLKTPPEPSRSTLSVFPWIKVFPLVSKTPKELQS
jgi:hypothetical protein